MDASLHALRYFVALAEELHFAAAARRLSISSPSLSQQISRLETSLGVRLFERTPRRVRLTADGEHLLPLASRVLEAHSEVLSWAQTRRDPLSAVLRVGIVAAGAGDLTTSILVAAVARMPELRLELRRLGFFETQEQLLSGGVDVVFAPGPFDAMSAEMSVTPIWTEPRVLVVPDQHRLAPRQAVSIAETSDETFVAASGGSSAVSGGSSAALDWWLVDPRPDGSSPRRGPVADDIEGLLELVAAGAGVNIAGASVATHYRRVGLAFVPIHDIEPVTIALMTRSNERTAAVQQFAQIAREHANVSVDES